MLDEDFQQLIRGKNGNPVPATQEFTRLLIRRIEKLKLQARFMKLTIEKLEHSKKDILNFQNQKVFKNMDVNELFWNRDLLMQLKPRFCEIETLEKGFIEERDLNIEFIKDLFTFTKKEGY